MDDRGLSAHRLRALHGERPASGRPGGFHDPSPRPLAEAISTAGGLSFDALTGQSQITALPGVFATGEMLDWEAPTGGYLLTTCMAHGRATGVEVVQYLKG